MNEGASIIVSLSVEKRERDRRLPVVATMPGGEEFKQIIRLEEKKERTAWLNEFFENYPGLRSERASLRRQIESLATDNELDLDIHLPHSKINGTATSSIDFWIRSDLALTLSGNLLDDKWQLKAGAAIAEKMLGRDASRQARDPLVRKVVTRLLREVRRLREQSASSGTVAHAVKGRDLADYRYVDGGINGRTKDGERAITDFFAKIVGEIWRDDGSGDPQLFFEVEASAGERKHNFTISSSEYEEMKWPLKRLGTAGVIRAGQTEHARTAIIMLSGAVSRKHVYICTGWIAREGKKGFLHAGGIITAEGAAAADVSLDGPLRRFKLPEPPNGAGLIAAIRSSLRMLELAPPEIIYPVFCAIWRSVLGASDFTPSLVGPSGAFKSELLALAQQYFGPEMVRTKLAGRWSGSENGLRELAYLAKDVLLGIDDYKLHGNSSDIATRKKADGLLQAAGDGAGKPRMLARGGLWEDHEPRTSLMSTGEQVPGTKSCIARQLVIYIPKGAINRATLTACQDDAARGIYAGTTAAYLQWLAGEDRITKIQGELESAVRALRDLASKSPAHARTPGTVAHLYAGLCYFLDFAEARGAVNATDRKRLQDTAWRALGAQAENQRKYLEGVDPATRYIELLESSLASGEAHLTGADGNRPGAADAYQTDEAERAARELSIACGWVREQGNWQRRGMLIGYWTEEGIALLPDAAFKVVLKSAGGGEVPIGTERDLREALFERGLLITRAMKEFEVERRTVQRRVGGKVRSVLLLRHEVLSLAKGALTVLTDDAPEVENLVFEPETAVRR